jgi:hypothetical protein
MAETEAERAAFTKKAVEHYEKGEPIGAIARNLGSSVKRVRSNLRLALGSRYRSPPQGRRPYSREEIVRRKKIGLESDCWEDYERRLGTARKNPRSDRLYGVRLGCVTCHERPGVGRPRLCSICRAKSRGRGNQA